jgi:hypothetical protein
VKAIKKQRLDRKRAENEIIVENMTEEEYSIKLMV